MHYSSFLQILFVAIAVAAPVQDYDHSKHAPSKYDKPSYTKDYYYDGSDDKYKHKKDKYYYEVGYKYGKKKAGYYRPEKTVYDVKHDDDDHSYKKPDHKS